MVYPELEITVDYELIDAKGVKMNTLKKKYKASQIEGKATKELLLIRIIDNLERNINRDFYEIVPIETDIIRIGLPNKKGEIDEVFINTPPELSEFSYDTYIFSERDVTVIDGVLKVNKILAKGKIKPRDVKSEGTKIRLKDNNKVIKDIFDRGEKMFAIISTNL